MEDMLSRTKDEGRREREEREKKVGWKKRRRKGRKEGWQKERKTECKSYDERKKGGR